MRIVEFRLPDDPAEHPIRVGVAEADGVREIEPSASTTGLKGLLDAGTTIEVASAANGPVYPTDTIEFLPLLASTGRVFAAGLNYEKKYPAGKQPPTPTHPPWFSKMPGTLVGHNQPVVAPIAHESFDYEAELAAVIGIGGRHISVDDALGHVAGWTCLNDGSVRAWQRHSVNAGKNFEQSGSVGPWMVTTDHIADPQNLRLLARVDGEVRQDASTSTMIFSVAEIIAYLSQAIALRPGDVIATGSPEGTGGSFDPPRFLVAGQTVEIEIEGIGVLRNPVIAEADASQETP